MINESTGVCCTGIAMIFELGGALNLPLARDRKAQVCR